MTMGDLQAMIDAAYEKDYNAANGIFNELIASRTNDALEAEKISMADAMFNGEDAADEVTDTIDTSAEEDIEIELSDEEMAEFEADEEAVENMSYEESEE